jgi:hypothetical protein
MTSATRPTIHVRVPTAEQFDGEDFLPAPDLLSVLGGLKTEHSTLDHLHQLDVEILWKRSGGKKGGRPVFGKTVKRSGLVSAFTSADFIVWLSADHVLEAEYTDRQITALLHHELMHISYEDPADDEEGARKYVLVGHDYEFFADELRIYGAWEEMLQEAADAFRQAPLFESEP